MEGAGSGCCSTVPLQPCWWGDMGGSLAVQRPHSGHSVAVQRSRSGHAMVTYWPCKGHAVATWQVCRGRATAVRCQCSDHAVVMRRSCQGHALAVHGSAAVVPPNTPAAVTHRLAELLRFPAPEPWEAGEDEQHNNRTGGKGSVQQLAERRQLPSRVITQRGRASACREISRACITRRTSKQQHRSRTWGCVEFLMFPPQLARGMWEGHAGDPAWAGSAANVCTAAVHRCKRRAPLAFLW